MIKKEPGTKFPNITRQAKHESCQIMVRGVCESSPPRGSVVFCHAPSQDKGMAHKSPDWWGAFGCRSCHAFLDVLADEHNALEYWYPAIFRTQKILVAEGLLVPDGLERLRAVCNEVRNALVDPAFETLNFSRGWKDSAVMIYRSFLDRVKQ